MAMDNQVLVSTNASEADVVEGQDGIRSPQPTLVIFRADRGRAHFDRDSTKRPGFTVQRRGQLDGYKVPPGAPPGWPFLK